MAQTPPSPCWIWCKLWVHFALRMVLPGEVICMRSEIRNRQGQVVIWTMRYELYERRTVFFWETTNQQTKELGFRKQRNTKQPQHETTERTNKKNMSWTMGLSFTSKLFASNERCSDFWNWRWILMRHVSHMELQQSIRWVVGVLRVGPSWFLWCRFFHVGKKWSDLAWQANQAAIGGHCEVLQLLQNFGAVLWQKTGVADGLGAYEVVGNGGWRAVWR